MLKRILLITGSNAAGIAVLAVVSVRAGALFGVGSELDAYFVAVSLPSLILSLSSSVVAAVLVPRLAPLSQDEARRRTGQWVALGILGTLPVVAIVVWQSNIVISILAPGFDAQTAHLAERVLGIMAFTLPATAGALIYSSYGYARRRVWVGGLSTTLYAACWLTLLFVPAFTRDVKGVAFACLLATQVQLLTAFLMCAPLRHLPWPRWGVPPGARAALTAAVGVLLATGISKFNILMDPIFGSFLKAGSVSDLSYAARIAILCIALAGQGASLTILGSSSSGTEQARRRQLAISVSLFFATGLAVGVAIAFQPVAVLLLAHGSLSTGNAEAIGALVQAYAAVIVTQTLAWSIESGLYAERKVRKVVIPSLISLLVNIGLSVPAVIVLGVYGRPVALTISMGLYAVLLVSAGSPEGGPKAIVAYLRRLPWQRVGELALGVAAVCIGIELLGESLDIVPIVASVLGMMAAAVVSIVVVRRWLSEQLPGRPEAVAAGADSR